MRALHPTDVFGDVQVRPGVIVIDDGIARTDRKPAAGYRNSRSSRRIVGSVDPKFGPHCERIYDLGNLATRSRDAEGTPHRGPQQIRVAQRQCVHPVMLGDTYLFGTTVVSSFRVSATRSEIPKIVDTFAMW